MNRTAISWPADRPGTLSLERIFPVLLVLGLGAFTLLMVVVSNGDPLMAVVPVFCVATFWAILISPVRKALFVLFFLALATDRPGDSEGLWRSPFMDLGGLLMHNISNTVPIPGAKVSGFVAILILLLIIRQHRYLLGRIVDTPDSIMPAPPMNFALGVSLVTVVWMLLLGIGTGGDTQMAKVQTQVILPMLGIAFVLGPSLRRRDYGTLGRIVVAAACCKAVMAVWMRQVSPEMVAAGYGAMREVEYATSHGDSLTFTCAALVLLVPIFFTPTKRNFMRLLLIGPILVAGLIANDRRLAWVELSIGLILLVIMNPRNWFTRRLIRTTILLSPILIVYVGVGWFSAARVFGPVKTLRSLVSAQRSDGSLDQSTLFRDVENYNLIYTFTQSPFIGRGFGHPFDAPVANKDLGAFKEYPYMPHNSLLGLIGFGGGFGLIGLLLPFVVGLFLAARASGLSQTPEDSMAAAIAIGNIGAFIMHMWGDIGFTELTAMITVGTSLAVAGQVAVSTGAWRIGQVMGASGPWRS